MRSPETFRPFPWADVLRLTLGLLRWPPDAVWRSTPREIAAALPHAAGAVAPLRRVELDALMRSHPDPAHMEHPTWL